jgi:hypothetical protein
MTTKHKAIYIEIRRAEGPIDETRCSHCGEQRVVRLYSVRRDGADDVWAASDKALQQMALSAPGNGEREYGVDKTDYMVRYANGDVYSGTYGLRFHDSGFTGLLARHMTTDLEWRSGRTADPWVGLTHYAELVSRRMSPEDQEHAAAFLDEHEIGSESSLWPREIPKRAAVWEHPLYVHTPSGRPVLTRFVRLCQVHREKREAQGETQFNPFRFDSDKRCDDCLAGDLIPGPHYSPEVVGSAA